MHGAQDTCLNACILSAENAHAPVHARLFNGAETSLSWKLLRTFLESCVSLVQAVVCRPPCCQWRRQLLRMFGPELIRINSLIETASAAKFWKRDISSASESTFPGFFGDIFGCSAPYCSLHKNLLASYNRCSHSVAPRALTCPFKQSNLSAWSYRNL